MTEHIKSKPRLFDELNSSHTLVHGSQSQGAIAIGWVVINTANSFASPMRNNFAKSAAVSDVVTNHRPGVAVQLAQHLATLPIASGSQSNGFDALGISMVSCANDGTPITVDATTPVPMGFGYAQFLSNLDQIYSTRFSSI